MATRSRPLYEATRLARWLRADMGRELRLARRTSDMRQRDVARIIGTSSSRVCRVEHGRIATLNLEDLARHAAAVGLKPYVKLFPLGRRLLDKPQIELLGRLRGRLHPTWSWATEVPIPREGDLRSCDCIIGIRDCTVLVEAFTRFADYQAQTASAARKKRDVGADRLILLVSATHANRKAVTEAAVVAAGSFSLSTKAVLRALSEGRDPATDAIVFL
jgi:transcriptional regulator with XRE-family HTH domain